MKKLSISFILLFGLFTFVPQIALGNRIVRVSYERTQELKKQKEKDLQCLNEKKLKISTEYNGVNLEIERETPSIFYFGSYEYTEPMDFSTNNVYKIDASYHLYSGNGEFTLLPLLGVSPSKNPIETRSGFVYNCKEYIVINQTDNYYPGRYTNAYDVTNVPPGSYLKYISETKEFQVLPPTDKSYKKIIESQKKQLEKRNERIKAEQKSQKEQERIRRNDKIKTTILNIIFVIGVLALLAIFVKEIIKKCKK